MAGTTTASANVATGGRAGSALHDGIINLNKLVTDVETVRLGATKAVALNSGGLVIHGSGSALAKTASAIYAYLPGASGAAGSIKKLAAADMADLAGTVTAAKFGIWWFTWDGTTQAATFTGGAVATLGAVPMPTLAATVACFGCLIVNPTGTGDFVGGTSALDDATIVPNAVYLNFTGTPGLTAAQVASGLTAAQIGDGTAAITT